ncbi:MAG TPA: hypothetical protein VFU81_22340, partial [Thermomicrobiales bacterium]|nr:hypothetical protein [Thermomicrobiales bacterium]
MARLAVGARLDGRRPKQFDVLGLGVARQVKQRPAGDALEGGANLAEVERGRPGFCRRNLLVEQPQIGGDRFRHGELAKFGGRNKGGRLVRS